MIIENYDDTEMRKMALSIKSSLKPHFTTGQLATYLGNDREKAENIITNLGFFGFLTSENMHGTWKHRIIDNPAEREVFIRANLAKLHIEKSEVDNSIEQLTSLLDRVVDELK